MCPILSVEQHFTEREDNDRLDNTYFVRNLHGTGCGDGAQEFRTLGVYHIHLLQR